MAEHTALPWKIRAPVDILLTRLQPCLPIDAGELCIADVWGEDGTAKANARLIAAAPELAEALQSLVDALGNCKAAIDGAFVFASVHGMDYTRGGKFTYGKQLDAARAALKKAGIE